MELKNTLVTGAMAPKRAKENNIGPMDESTKAALVKTNDTDMDV